MHIPPLTENKAFIDNITKQFGQIEDEATAEQKKQDAEQKAEQA